MIELIVTGTGRCGTGFAAKWLTSIGIPCGHERIFQPLGLGQLMYNLRQGPPLMADAAWESAPYLRLDRLEDVPVIHLTRHPRRVLESLVRVPPAVTPVYDEFCKVHFPCIYKYTSRIDQAAARVLSITRRIEELRPEEWQDRYIWRVEDGVEGALAWLAGEGLYNPAHDPGKPFTNTRYNHKAGEPVEVRIDQMDAELAADMIGLCHEYGYEWDERDKWIN